MVIMIMLLDIQVLSSDNYIMRINKIHHMIVFSRKFLLFLFMYAIVENGGKQYKVSPGDKIRVEKLSIENGSELILDKVLMISSDGDSIFGSPYIEGAKVFAIVEGSGKAKKILIYKQKPRKSSKKLRGHRQFYTLLKIKDIVLGGSYGT